MIELTHYTFLFIIWATIVFFLSNAIFFFSIFISSPLLQKISSFVFIIHTSASFTRFMEIHMSWDCNNWQIKFSYASTRKLHNFYTYGLWLMICRLLHIQSSSWWFWQRKKEIFTHEKAIKPLTNEIKISLIRKSSWMKLDRSMDTCGASQQDFWRLHIFHRFTNSAWKRFCDAAFDLETSQNWPSRACFVRKFTVDVEIRQQKFRCHKNRWKINYSILRDFPKTNEKTLLLLLHNHNKLLIT